jgi:hypothetical protein
MVIQKLRAKNQTYSGRWMFTTSRTTDAIVWQPETIILQAARLKILYGSMAPIYIAYQVILCLLIEQFCNKMGELPEHCLSTLDQEL